MSAMCHAHRLAITWGQKAHAQNLMMPSVPKVYHYAFTAPPKKAQHLIIPSLPQPLTSLIISSQSEKLTFPTLSRPQAGFIDKILSYPAFQSQDTVIFSVSEPR